MFCIVTQVINENNINSNNKINNYNNDDVTINI